MNSEISLKSYLTTLIEEKGTPVTSVLKIEKAFNFTWGCIFDSLSYVDDKTQATIKSTVAKIDAKNGDVFHYLNFLAEGMIKEKFGDYM